MSWIDALKAEIDSKKLELVEVQAAIAKAKDLMSEVSRLESILLSATGAAPSKKTKGGKGGRKAWSEQQKQAARDRWAKKKADAAAAGGQPVVKKVKAAKA